MNVAAGGHVGHAEHRLLMAALFGSAPSAAEPPIQERPASVSSKPWKARTSRLLAHPHTSYRQKRLLPDRCGPPISRSCGGLGNPAWRPAADGPPGEAGPCKAENICRF